MKGLTKRQREVLEFIRDTVQSGGIPPTLREICDHFGFRSVKAASDHVAALRRKGFLVNKSHQARALQLVSPLQKHRKPTRDIPVFGSIPAGPPDECLQEAEGCLTIDVGTLGFKPGPRTFAVRVRGDSMIGRHICDGDLVVLEHGRTPRNGDVVAALIDNESTLKTYVHEKGKKPYLKAENPRYSKTYPAEELVIQGVMVALIRKTR
ncbi:MAG: repressor LexA [Verrucomicrobia bacterium]|nr:MAG: repressor LexA [Verrucomicrobiota bacterium]